WGAYERHLETEKHKVGKRNTQKIERKNLNFRTWIKRLTRRTIVTVQSAPIFCRPLKNVIVLRRSIWALAVRLTI
ncbi:MAG: IS1 family transposase, partial [Thermodesulfobacteriota bacterium]|nr:IS1 family transposase [Thermodesulfobacteriota bacterium]